MTGKMKRWKEKQSKLETEYVKMMTEIRRVNPRYSDLQNPEPIRLSQVQSLIEPGTAILEYFVGRKASAVFVVTSDQLLVYPLPPHQKLNEQIREFLDAIQKPASLTPIRYEELALGLYGDILKPAEALLKDRKRLIIVPDGPLNYLPYEGLLTSKATKGSNFSQLPYVAVNYEIQYVPSVSS